MTGKNILAFVPMDTLDYYIDIDNRDDFEKAKSIVLKHFYKKNNEKKNIIIFGANSGLGKRNFRKTI